MSSPCTNKKSLGAHLSTCRTENGKSPYWSIENVATRAGITKTYLFKIEKDYSINVSTKVLKALSLILQTNYEKLLLLAGHIDHDGFTKRKKRVIPIFGEIKKNKTHIDLFNKKIEETKPIDNIFKENKKLVGIRTTIPITIGEYPLVPSNIIIIPLSHIELPIEDITVIAQFL